MQETMTETLKEHYGVDFHNLRNRQITDAWDKAQEKVECSHVCFLKNCFHVTSKGSNIIRILIHVVSTSSCFFSIVLYYCNFTIKKRSTLSIALSDASNNVCIVWCTNRNDYTCLL